MPLPKVPLNAYRVLVVLAVISTRHPCRLGGGDGDGSRRMRCWEAKWKEPMGGIAGSSPSPASVIPGAPHPHPDRGQL
jgi:hypothetical protein